MNKIPPPQEKIRLSLADEIPTIGGIYILAYLGKVLYVGKAEMDIMHRLESHKTNALDTRELLGKWMIRCQDWENVRVDLLIPPEQVDTKWWLQTVESACVRKLTPLLNQHLQSEAL